MAALVHRQRFHRPCALVTSCRLAASDHASCLDDKCAPSLKRRRTDTGAVDTDDSGLPPWTTTTRACLVELQLEDFKSFGRKCLKFEDRTVCITGDNGSGKSSIVDAIRFVLLQSPVRGLRYLVKQGQESCEAARVTAVFHSGESKRPVVLRREVRLDGADVQCQCWSSADGKPLERCTELTYTAWISEALCWKDDAIVLQQFALLERQSVAQMLEELPSLMEQRFPHEVASPKALLKRLRTPCRQRYVGKTCEELSPSAPSRHWLAPRALAEQRLDRRFDEIYRELTREPLDDAMQQWGEGGQASLRRVADGSFGLVVYHRRGVPEASGIPFHRLSDGGRDICGLALTLALSSLDGHESLPPFVMLDEPDARLDKQHAQALWRLLSGPKGPKQCLLTSLNNHSAFRGFAIQLENSEA